MSASHNLTRLFLALSALIALCAIALGQPSLTDSDVQVSDQKAGSFLVYPYYASGAAGSGSGDTRITISNVGPTAPVGAVPGFVPPGGSATTPQTIAVHLFFLDATCSQADVFLCLTPNASVAFKASDYDPFTTRGALYAVAVDPASGYPIAYNGLIGNAFVNYTDAAGRAYVGNYGAEAFFAIGAQVGGPGNPNFYTGIVPGAPPSPLPGSVATPLTAPTGAQLYLNNRGPRQPFFPGYDAAPTRFAVEIQSVLDARDQTIVTAGLNGTIGGTVTGAAQVGVGTVVNGNEKPFGSFTGFGGGCTGINILTASNPRVPLGMNGIIPSGQTGTIQWNVGGAVGLIMTPQRVGQVANAWSGIRTLHKTAVNEGFTPATAVTLTIPIFTPVC